MFPSPFLSLIAGIKASAAESLELLIKMLQYLKKEEQPDSQLLLVPRNFVDMQCTLAKLFRTLAHYLTEDPDQALASRLYRDKELFINKPKEVGAVRRQCLQEALRHLKSAKEAAVKPEASSGSASYTAKVLLKYAAFCDAQYHLPAHAEPRASEKQAKYAKVSVRLSAIRA